MKAIADFFAALGDMLLAAFRFLFSLIEDLIYMIKMLFEIGNYMPEYLSFLPGTIVGGIAAAFGVWIVLRLIGKDG